MSAHATSDPVGKLVARGAVSVHPDDTIEELARILTREGIGAVLVRGHEGIVGIVSERDVVRALADPDLAAERAGDIMTFGAETVVETATIDEVARLMIDGHVRHVPVIDGAGVVGVVSIRDVLATFVGDPATS